MGLQYQCINHSCNFPGETRFEMKFTSEAIMDNNNLAAAFCPFCKKEMVPSFLMDIPRDPSENQANERL
ncbi:MAG: hypothetical protein K8S13_02470 [Desulfobacula sp.]|uniref:hypothetical protein n=1 Tax=Desulfobacula sp. TaxID=2593537 RepID=UPI0025C37703|nr:hypothetical protein [Desulfobacula sp.]MCD4718710.1 hypothetical protein [Desulfobacula sp.]